MKWKGKFITLLMGTSIALAACGGGEDNDSSSADGADKTVSVADAEKIYNQSCSQCHGTDLQGKPPAFPDLSAVGSKLSKEEIETTILEGKNAMPPGLIDGAEAAAVAEWLAAKK